MKYHLPDQLFLDSRWLSLLFFQLGLQGGGNLALPMKENNPLAYFSNML